MFGIWCSAQVPQTGGGEGGTQKRPHSVLTVVHEVGLGLLDIEVNGIGGAVGNVEVLPRVLMAGLRAVLFARHPDGKAGVIEPEAVERAGEAQLFDGGAQVAEEGVEVHGREPSATTASTTVSRAAPSRTPTCDRQIQENTSKMAVKASGRRQRFWWRNKSKERNLWNDAASMVMETLMGCDMDNISFFRHSTIFFSRGKRNLAQMAENVVE